ncbi:MAG: Sapep family Mn(2+)-dependent dipeptidase [Coprobacillus sp.]|nr:Sapep family Mn(2+)-dependent dipeptidase [Coprobacillus sp.]
MSKNSKIIHMMTRFAMEIALIVIMTFVPYIGYITIGGTISFTTVHIVVIVCSMAFGWQDGLVTGLAFGVFSLIKAATMPMSVADVDFINPLVSVLPRLLFGLAAGFSFEGIRKIPSKSVKYVVAIIAVPVLTLFHSACTLTAYYLVEYLWLAKYSGGYIAVIGTIFTINGLIEIVSATVISPAVTIALSFGIKGDKNIMAITKEKNLRKIKTSQYTKMTKPYEDSLFTNLTKFVAINSVYDESSVTKEKPYGDGVTNALNFICELATKDGFSATNYGNQIVEILFNEGKDKNVTILSHCDTVPTGKGWTSDPFTVKEVDGVLYGRGVSDDKGPTMAAYYALKAIKDNNLYGDYTIRLLVGGNEERGCSEMKYYFDSLGKSQPTIGFTPDGDYPLIFGEKGIVNYTLSGPIDIPQIISITGGEAVNAVIDSCTVVMPHNDNFISLFKRDKVKYDISSDKGIDTITFYGKSAHGSTPEQGVNAAFIALKYVDSLSINPKLHNLIKSYEDLNGRGLKAYGSSEKMGENTLNVGTISYKEGKLTMGVNFRYVETCDYYKLLDAITENSKPFKVKVDLHDHLLYYPTDSALIQTLLRVYKEETKDKTAEPLAIGGGTYAKEASNTVCFGMQHLDYDTYMHSNKERVRKEDLTEAMAMYMHGIIELGNVIS